jgi:enterochelin esterase-like enzyme
MGTIRPNDRPTFQQRNPGKSPMRHEIPALPSWMWLVAVLGCAAIASQPVSGAETDDPQRVSLGLRFGLREACGAARADATPRGVCVLGTRPHGAVDRAGIKAGDILQRLGNTTIETADDLLSAVGALRVGENVRAVVLRQNESMTLSIDLTPQDRASSSESSEPLPAASQPQLPFEILPLPAETQSIADKVREVETAIWIDGEVLSIVHRDEREEIGIMGTFQVPMTRVPGTHLWVLQMKMHGWEQAFFSYSFISRSEPKSSDPAIGYFRGPNAPEFPSTQQTLRGRLTERTLHSKRLNEDRKITIYLPPGARNKQMPALFMADGQSIGGFARVVEPLIAAGRIAPFVIVGVHASLSPLDVSKPRDVAQDRRSQEYLLAVAPEKFANHMAFFIEEVLPWAAREYGLSTNREDRAIFGFSSGAAFATAAALLHPDVFANALPFSICFPRVPDKPVEALPSFHFVAGELEPDCAAGTSRVYELVRSWGARASFDSFPSGHDPLLWQLALARSVPEVFPLAKR